MNPKRIVCHFSCGAASAVATKMAIAENKAAASPLPLVIIYCHVVEEDTDNMRFLRECEEWFGTPIQVLQDTKYNGSVVEVIRKKRFINSSKGAPCTANLKKAVGAAFAQFGDINVFGFTSEERERLDLMLDANNAMRVSAPLIDAGMDKGACLALVERAGIDLPRLYAMGYDHNNCIGCVKGGAWYWNKIRDDFPERFAQQMELEEWVGHPTLRINKQPVWLRDLTPGRGRKHDEPKIECGVACELAETVIFTGDVV